MLFTTPAFLIFFAIVGVAYYALPRYQMQLVLLASCLFYGYFSLPYLALFSVLALCNFILAQKIEAAAARKKILLTFGIVLNLAVLCLYRFVLFPDANTAALGDFLHWNYGAWSLSLLWPIGLSYLVFQAISYLVDVHRAVYPAERSFVLYLSFVLFFPKLLAGPVEKPSFLLPQLKLEHRFDGARIRAGLERMLWGFFKKLVIADNIALLVAHVYLGVPGNSAAPLLFLLILYPFQMYADFSGYVDIALGIAAILGIELTENFNRPFSSHSITEYWRRWHISVSTWFRDHVYFPLTYSKTMRSWPRRYAALFATFLISGLWHSATWTFFAFGLFNACVRILDSATLNVRLLLWALVDGLRMPRLSGALQILFTYLLTCFSLLFFGAPSIDDAFYVLEHLPQALQLLFYPPAGDPALLSFAALGISVGLFAAVVAAIIAMELVQYAAARGYTLGSYSRPVRYGTYLALLSATLLFGNIGPVSFIYFRF